MKEKLGITVIGTGDMGNQHVNGWQLAGHEVVSVVDVDLARAREIAGRYNVPQAYADYKEAIAQPNVDVVSISLPLKFHAPVTIFAAEQGKHVFCEKPLARSFAEVKEMEEAVRKAGVQFGIGFQRNLAEDVGLIRQYVEQGKFGHPLLFNGELLAEVRPKVAMHDRNGNNGPIMDACCHHFMLMQTMFGSKPKTVYAQGRIFAKDRPEVAHFEQLAIDTSVITIVFESGDIGTMTVSWGLAKQAKFRRHPDRIIGPIGGMEAAGANELRIYQEDRVQTVSFANENLHQKQFAIFVDALRRGIPAPVGLHQGKEMLAVTLAIFESIETGHPVSVTYDMEALPS